MIKRLAYVMIGGLLVGVGWFLWYQRGLSLTDEQMASADVVDEIMDDMDSLLSAETR